MCVTAHPDDECFAFGGALALAAQQGVETYVLCLTDGQAATHRGNASSGQELGRIRRAEFAASCSVLGVRHHELLDYEDGRLEFESLPRISGRLVERMRRFRPDVVITFGGDGGLNSHADHMMVSMFTSAAFHWSGREQRYPDLAAPHTPTRLFHLSANFFLPERRPPLPIPWTVSLDISSVAGQKEEAFRQHLSQSPLLDRTKDLFARFGSHEFYTLVAAAEPQPATASTSLFAGLLTPPAVELTANVEGEIDA